MVRETLADDSITNIRICHKFSHRHGRLYNHVIYMRFALMHRLLVAMKENQIKYENIASDNKYIWDLDRSYSPLIEIANWGNLMSIY
jgi:hypothetical protein